MTDQDKSTDDESTLLPPQVPLTPSPEDSSSLLSPWWSEEPTTEQDNAAPKETDKHSTLLLGLSRSMEHNGDKEMGWKEKCYVLANGPKTDNLEKLFDGSKECTMVCFLRESRKLARQRLLMEQQNSWNPLHGIWVSVAKTPKRCKEHIFGEQSLITPKGYLDYYNIDLGKETSHSGEHVTRMITKTFSPLQHLAQRYIDSWKDGTQQAFFTNFWSRLQRGDAFYLVKDCTKRVIENVLEDKKPSDKK